MPKVSFTDADDNQDEETQRIQTVRKTFNRFERKSIFTIAKITKDPRYVLYVNAFIPVFLQWTLPLPLNLDMFMVRVSI